MRQSPDFAIRLKLSPQEWQHRCDELYDRYRKLGKDLRRNAVSGKEPFENVMPILQMKNPMNAINLLIRGLQQEVDRMRTDAVKLPEALQDLVWTQIQAVAGFRPATWKDVTWRSDGTGHLRRDENGWLLIVPKKFFKNETGKALRADFRRRLPDTNGLYLNLDRYLTVARPLLTQGMKTDLLFIYGRKNLESRRIKPQSGWSSNHQVLRERTRLESSYVHKATSSLE